MRADGHVIFYLVQHYGNPGGGRSRGWVESGLDHLLFSKLHRDDSRGEYYRALLDPQSASSELWQRYGINGFPTQETANAARLACTRENPDMRFRVVKRQIVQMTKVVDA